jgi:hypothetical protein
LIEVTWILLHFKIVPKELAITPFPTPLITPPVTKMNFILNTPLYQQTAFSLHTYTNATARKKLSVVGGRRATYQRFLISIEIRVIEFTHYR